MDGGTDSSLWQRILKIFHSKNSCESVEQAILDAEEDGDILADEKSMLLRVLRLDELLVQDIMTPLSDVTAISSECTLNESVKIIVESGHSRVPVYQGNKENIIGIVYAKDMIKYIYQKAPSHSNITEFMREPYFVPETKNAAQLLHEFRARKNHLALLLNEYGSVVGIISIEDIIEQIVGEIEDEHDMPKEDDIKALDSTHFILSGRTTLEDLESEVGLKIESEDVDTIGGYLCELAGKVPQAGDVFALDACSCEIVDADNTQVRTIKIELLEKADERE
ncbi:hemolysin family protein [Desulfovibrio litoralis]|uniref:Magnesium and cobalt transporter n=1 Tax=Desulfovibrio litoralis DSM 11393 TaxID=1121455 RepID=A0A1M7S8Y6_9BACT|nr:hemolysin family protein [Desulfovibrio litoralis]SHN55047.1 magnesium and cobalt transporter [Desulfovibrio litoralis DSM 11393]